MEGKDQAQPEDAATSGATSEILKELYAELEQRVRVRTAELTAVNEALRHEMADRLKVEEAVRAGQELFRTFFELGLVGFAVTSPKRGWLVVNDRLCEMLGYSREELAGMTWDQLTHPEGLSAELEAFEKARCGTLEGGHLEQRYIRKDGRILHAIVSHKCVRKSDGSLHYVLSVVEDITEQVAAREKIEQLAAASAVELNKLQAIISAMGEGLIIADPQGNLVMANPAALALLGYESFEELPRQLAAHCELQEVFDVDGRLLPLEQWPLSRALGAKHFPSASSAFAGTTPPDAGPEATAGRPCSTQAATWRWVSLRSATSAIANSRKTRWRESATICSKSSKPCQMGFTSSTMSTTFSTSIPR
jgi:PAS domain S-box-containing protein